MLRKFTVALAGLALASALVIPATASAAKKPTPSQQACLAPAKTALETALATNRAAVAAFLAQQKAQVKTFLEQQQAAREAFKATNPTDAQKQAFRAQQKAAAKALHERLKSAGEAFWAQQKAVLTPALESFKAALQSCLSQP
jgi:hypothetical protein